MGLAIGVAHPDAGERAAHRPGEREANHRALPRYGRRPVEVGRGVEVAGEERRHAGGDEAPQRPQVRAQEGQADAPLEGEQLGARRAVAGGVRAVRIGGEMRVGERDDAPAAELGVDVLTAPAGGVD
jgi:hypothetical protein